MLIKVLKKLYEIFFDLLSPRDKIIIEDILEIYQPIINYPMSAKDAKDILEVCGQIMSQKGLPADILVNQLKSKYYTKE